MDTVSLGGSSATDLCVPALSLHWGTTQGAMDKDREGCSPPLLLPALSRERQEGHL